MRVLSFTLLVMLVVGVLVDPTTFHLNASHAAPAAPVWQTALALADLCMLAVALILSVEHRYRWAILALSAETAFHVLLSVAYLTRDGLSRFANNIGHDEYLALYMLLISVRAILIGSWAIAARGALGPRISVDQTTADRVDDPPRPRGGGKLP